MDKSTIIGTLREHEDELRATGILRLSLFGSYARGTDITKTSDVDLLADFDKSKHLTLVTVGNLENRLADLLGAKVDLSAADWMEDPIRQRVLREAVSAF